MKKNIVFSRLLLCLSRHAREYRMFSVNHSLRIKASSKVVSGSTFMDSTYTIELAALHDITGPQAYFISIQGRWMKLPEDLYFTAKFSKPSSTRISNQIWHIIISHTWDA